MKSCKKLSGCAYVWAVIQKEARNWSPLGHKVGNVRNQITKVKKVQQQSEERETYCSLVCRMTSSQQNVVKGSYKEAIAKY